MLSTLGGHTQESPGKLRTANRQLGGVFARGQADTEGRNERRKDTGACGFITEMLARKPINSTF